MVKVILLLAICLVAFPMVVTGQSITTGQPHVDSGPEETLSGNTVDARLQKEPELVLLGTVVLPDPGAAMAIIQVGKTGEQGLYWLGDVVAGGHLTKILRDRVTLTFAEMEVELSLTGGERDAVAVAATVTERVQPPLRQTDGGFWRVERKTLDDLSRAPELITNVRSLDAGGVRLDNVQADDLFRNMGMQQGDIIRNINGQVPGEDLSLQEAIAQTEVGQTILRLEVERQGSMNVLYYEFDP